MSRGLAVSELSDAQLEEQGTHAHATRNWVFLHGTAEQFGHHTERMLELEQEYLRRFPKRTWQGSGDSPAEVDEATRLRLALRGLAGQIAALLADSVEDDTASIEPDSACAACCSASRPPAGGYTSSNCTSSRANSRSIPQRWLLSTEDQLPFCGRSGTNAPSPRRGTPPPWGE